MIVVVSDAEYLSMLALHTACRRLGVDPAALLERMTREVAIVRADEVAQDHDPAICQCSACVALRASGDSLG